MNREEVERVIQSQLKERAKRVVNRNALDALLSALGGNALTALGKLFLGRQDALAAEKLRIQQDLVLDLLCRIDETISNSKVEAIRQGVDWTIISGEIEAHGTDVEEVTGAHIASNSGPTELKPGTHIRASGTRVKRVTGLHVGDRDKQPEDK